MNPEFLVLHYRLGIGDGPVPFRIGARWASDYRSVSRHESWFWHVGRHRVLQRQWDRYLVNPDSGWRRYWATRVLYEARLLGDDGVFADSLSVPQYLGAAGFSPSLRYCVGEAAWTGRIDRFMRYEVSRLRVGLSARAAGRWRRASGECLDGRLAAVARVRRRRIGDGVRARWRRDPPALASRPHTGRSPLPQPWRRGGRILE